MKVKRAIAWASGIGLLLHAVLLVASWILSAAWPELNVQSLLSSQGIRWTFGNFTENLTQPFFLWLVLAAMAWSLCRRSQLGTALRHPRQLNYRCRTALTITLLEIAVIVLVFVYLTCTPHAVLLGITGHLVPSRFVYNLIPTLALCAAFVATTYGLISGTLRTIHDVVGGLSAGIEAIAPLVVLYVIAVQLVFTTAYVFMF